MKCCCYPRFHKEQKEVVEEEEVVEEDDEIKRKQLEMCLKL